MKMSTREQLPRMEQLGVDLRDAERRLQNVTTNVLQRHDMVWQDEYPAHIQAEIDSAKSKLYDEIDAIIEERRKLAETE